MTDWTSTFKSFYTHFILRDFFAKIIPGTFLLLVLLISLLDEEEVWKIINYSNIVWLWILFLGVAWIFGFAIQAIGEKILFLRYYPKTFTTFSGIEKDLTQDIFHDMHLQFSNNASESDMQNYERLVVIKEACGNNYCALFISIIIFVVYLALPNFLEYSALSNYLLKHQYESYFIIGFLIIITIFLRIMHTLHVHRQFNIMKQSKVIKGYF